MIKAITLSILSFVLVSCSTTKKNMLEAQKDSEENAAPNVSSPAIRKIRVLDHIEGNRFIKGHDVFILERGSVWTMP